MLLLSCSIRHRVIHDAGFVACCAFCLLFLCLLLHCMVHDLNRPACSLLLRNDSLQMMSLAVNSCHMSAMDSCMAAEYFW